MLNNMKTPGIPDALFERGNVPLTKEEIRTLVLAKLNLSDDSRIVDVGAGTGSVTIECALRARHGVVYAIERSDEACALIASNLKKFNVENVHLIAGEAPAAFAEVGSFNRAFVGGSGGNLTEILDYLASHIEADGVIVVTAITLDTLFAAREFFRIRNMMHEIIHIAVTRITEISALSMLQAQTPVFIITARTGDA